MASEEILSPPFPSDTATDASLYSHFKDLRRWVYHYRDGLNAEAGQDLIPQVRTIPDCKAYTGQPIVTKYYHLASMRKIREAWDSLIREYEDDWDNGMCVRRRIMILQTAVVLINGAFTPQELREAQQRQEMERTQRTFEGIWRTIYAPLEPAAHGEEKEEYGY